MLSNTLPIYLDILKLDLEKCFDKYNYKYFLIDFLSARKIVIIDMTCTLCVRDIYQFIKIESSIGLITFDLKRLLDIQFTINSI